MRDDIEPDIEPIARERPQYGTKEYYRWLGRRGGLRRVKKGFAARPELAAPMARKRHQKEQINEQEG